GRDASEAKARKGPGIARTLARANRLLVLAPKQPTAYQVLAAVHALTRDLAALRKVDRDLRDAELDLSDATREALGYYAGKHGSGSRQQAAAAASRWEKRYRELGAGRRGATFAVAAVSLSQALCQRDRLGEEVDADRVVRLAEEAHAAA